MVGSVDAAGILAGFGSAVRCSRWCGELSIAAAEFVKGSAPPRATKATDDAASDVADDAGDDAAAFGTADDPLGVIRRRRGQ